LQDGKEAVQDADPPPAGYLSELQRRRGEQVRAAGRSEDLQTALTVSKQAVDAASSQAQHLAASLAIRAIALRLEAARTLSPEGIQASVAAGRQAVEAAGRRPPAAGRQAVDIGVGGTMAADCVSNYALCLLLRYEAASSADDLNEAIELSRQAAAMVSWRPGCQVPDQRRQLTCCADSSGSASGPTYPPASTRARRPWTPCPHMPRCASGARAIWRMPW